MSKPKIDLNKIQISDEVKEQIKFLAERHKKKSIEVEQAGFDNKSFEIIYYLFGMCNLTLMVILNILLNFR